MLVANRKDQQLPALLGQQQHLNKIHSSGVPKCINLDVVAVLRLNTIKIPLRVSENC